MEEIQRGKSNKRRDVKYHLFNDMVVVARVVDDKKGLTVPSTFIFLKFMFRPYLLVIVFPWFTFSRMHNATRLIKVFSLNSVPSSFSSHFYTLTAMYGEDLVEECEDYRCGGLRRHS